MKAVLTDGRSYKVEIASRLGGFMIAKFIFTITKLQAIVTNIHSIILDATNHYNPPFPSLVTYASILQGP